ncbi:MAG: amidoligase family protein, partial [Verrucomicrobiota bacterium]
LITPPLDGDHSTQLEALLRMARDLDFSLPLEGATHLHFDAAPLCDASTMANLIRYLSVHRESLRTRFAVNSRCRRLGAWPEELLDTVSSPEFVALRWEEARTRLRQVKLTKYCDFNLQNIVRGDSNKHTLEVRILPSHLETEPILEAAAIVASIIAWARGGRGRLLPVPEDLDRLVDS